MDIVIQKHIEKGKLQGPRLNVYDPDFNQASERSHVFFTVITHR